MIRFAKLKISVDAAAIRQELTAVKENWLAHFNTYQYEGSWTVVALRTPGGKPDHIIPELMDDSEYMDTLYMHHFPAVKNLLSNIACPIMAVRFLNLKAGAVIKPHRDNELAFEKGEARLHFPIQTNPRVEFYIDGERIVLDEGDCWYVNANLPHSVKNGGDEDRIHLVIDCKVNDWLGKLMNTSMKLSMKNESEELLKVIKELRLQNNPVATQMADNLTLTLT